MFDRLILIVLKALLRHSVERLLGVEAIRSAVPDVAQLVDVEVAIATTLLHHNLALLDGLTNLHKAHTCLVQQILHSTLVCVLHLHNHTWIFSKEQLHRVALIDAVEIHLDTTLLIGESHLQQCGDETTCTDVVTSQQEFFLHQILHSQESIAEVLRILYGWHIASHLAQTLSKGRTTQLQGVEREVDMIERCVGIVDQHRADNLLHIAHFTT